MYENNESEEEYPKGSNCRKFSPSHGSPLYVWDRDDQSWMLRAGRCVDSSTARSEVVPVNNDYSAHAHYNESVFVPALAFNPMSLASASLVRGRIFYLPRAASQSSLYGSRDISKTWHCQAAHASMEQLMSDSGFNGQMPSFTVFDP